MYSMLIRMTFRDISKAIKNNKGRIILVLFLSVFFINGNSSIKMMLGDNVVGETVIHSQYLIAVFGAMYLNMAVFSEVPLRVCKGLYICPAGYQEKMRYLYAQLFLKMLIGAFVIAVYIVLGVKEPFYDVGISFQVILLMLSFFAMFNIVVNVGRKDFGTKKLDGRGYLIRSREEEIFKVYWTSLLGLELAFFIIDVKEWVWISEKMRFNIWVVLFVINMVVVVRYTRKVLEEVLSYEEVYAKQPEVESVQYDF